MHSVGVGEAHKIEPVTGHMLTVLFPGEKEVDEVLVSAGTFVGEKCTHLHAGRGQTREVESETSDERASVSIGGRGQLFAFKTPHDMKIDFPRAPLPVSDVRGGGFFRRNEGPELLVSGSLENPLSDDFLIFPIEWLLVCLPRGHALVRIRGGDATP